MLSPPSPSYTVSLTLSFLFWAWLTGPPGACGSTRLSAHASVGAGSTGTLHCRFDPNVSIPTNICFIFASHLIIPRRIQPTHLVSTRCQQKTCLRRRVKQTGHITGTSASFFSRTLVGSFVRQLCWTLIYFERSGLKSSRTGHSRRRTKL